ncbi:MAG TPA: J domain-containing protein [Hyphomicrobiaceae bacterium]|nr:J domain-containing protein [Hyphomicrobiaceae bacterium]
MFKIDLSNSLFFIYLHISHEVCRLAPHSNLIDSVFVMRDYYAILGLSRTAGPEDIKSSYRRLVKQFHPDMMREKPTAPLRIYEVNEAYAILNDRRRRAVFDLVFNKYCRYRRLRVAVSLLAGAISFAIFVIMPISSSKIRIACGSSCMRGDATDSLVKIDDGFVPWVDWKGRVAEGLKTVSGWDVGHFAGRAMENGASGDGGVRDGQPPVESKLLFASSLAFATMLVPDKTESKVVYAQSPPDGLCDTSRSLFDAVIAGSSTKIETIQETEVPTQEGAVQEVSVQEVSVHEAPTQEVAAQEAPIQEAPAQIESIAQRSGGARVVGARVEQGRMLLNTDSAAAAAGAGTVPLPEIAMTRTWAKFSDPQKEISFRYPRNKFPLKRIADASSVLVSGDGRAVVRLRRDSWITGASEPSERQAIARKRYVGADVNVKDSEGGFVLTGVLHGEAFQERFIFSCTGQVAHSLLIVYPFAEKSAYAATVAGIDGSYRATLPTSRTGSRCSPPGSS